MRNAFFLTSGPPIPIAGARRIRDAQIISALSKKMHVEVLCVAETEQLPTIQAKCFKLFGDAVRVSCHPLDRKGLFTKALNLVRPDFAQGYSESIENYLNSRTQPGDLVWISRLRMAKYIGVARKLGAHTVLDEHQVESDLMFDNAFTHPKYWHQGLTAAQCMLYEKNLCSEAELVVTSSSLDATRMQKLAPQSVVKIVPHAIHTATYQLAQREGTFGSENPQLLFFGDLDYRPNIHAIEWFMKEIIPRLRAALAGKLPKIVLASQTDACPKEFSNLPSGIEFVNYATTEQLLDHFSRTTAVVFPLRYGRGNRINVLEAMGSGMPIVSTGKGADGLVIKPSYDIVIAEEEDAFTSSILRVLRDTQFRKLLSSHARETAQKLYDWKGTQSAIDQVLSAVGI